MTEREEERKKGRERERERGNTKVKYEFILERVKGEETRECGYSKRVDLCERVCVCVCEGYREREGGERERE